MQPLQQHLINALFAIKYVSHTAKLLFIEALSDCWKNFYVVVTMGEISNNEINLCPANNRHDIRPALSKLYFKHNTNGSLVSMTSKR